MNPRRTRSGRMFRSRGRPRSPEAQALVAVAILAAPLWILLLRHSLAQLLALENVAPDALAVAVAAVAWTRSPFLAVAFAVLLGTCADVTSATPFGLYAARLGGLAAIFASARQVVALDELPGGSVLITGTFVVLERCLAALCVEAWVPEADLEVLLQRALCIGLYSACLGPFAFAVARTLSLRTGVR